MNRYCIFLLENSSLKIKIYIILIFGLLFHSNNLYALSIIRDSEIENLLFKISKPLILAAGLNEKDINIYIVDDRNINAFVAGGRNVFINTGLITKYNNPTVLQGVMAHEIGHISAGHLARGDEALKNANSTILLNYLLGLALMLAAGHPDAGYSVFAGGSQVANRLALSFNRSQEEVADKLAVEYLKKANISPNGLLQLLSFFKQEQILFSQVIDEYAITHPISQKRIDYISNISNHDTYRPDPILAQQLSRVIVKIESFSRDPDYILESYKNNTLLSYYARSIAYYRKGRVKKSLEELNYLLKKEANNGYFWELKGQILFDNGLVKDAIFSYKKAMNLIKNPFLVKISIAHAIIALNSKDKELLQIAIDYLDSAILTEPRNAALFKNLYRAYSQLDKKDRAYLNLAEFYFLQDNKDKALEYVKLSKKNITKNDKFTLLKLKDLISEIKKSK